MLLLEVHSFSVCIEDACKLIEKMASNQS
jgi:hypothetical protein